LLASYLPHRDPRPLRSFPKTEIQVYGNTAVVYSNYSYELEPGGQRINQAGRVTEVFALRTGNG
jgi:hypothetical protein